MCVTKGQYVCSPCQEGEQDRCQAFIAIFTRCQACVKLGELSQGRTPCPSQASIMQQRVIACRMAS